MSAAAEARPGFGDNVPFVDLQSEYARHKTEIDAAAAGVLQRGDFILGEAVSRFEAAFARYVAVDHAVGVDSGFSALELIFRALDLGPGDEVITQANTFIATVAAIESTGARAVLVDVDATTNNMDPDALEAAITDATRVVVPVHLYGMPADMDRIAAITRPRGIKIVEDACQAHGAFHGGRRAGSLGDAAAFSFYPSKNLGAAGDGGIVVTSDPAIADRVRLLRNLGSGVKYRHDIRGFNHRLDTIHAAILEVKLPHLDDANASRTESARRMNKELASLPLVTPSERDGFTPVYHLYVIETDERERLQEHLTQRGISTGIHYPIPIHMQPAYRSLGYSEGAFPVSEQKAGRILSLPMYPHMPVEVVDRVIGAVRAFFEER